MSTKPAEKKTNGDQRTAPTGGEFASAADDINKTLGVKPPLDLTIGEEKLGKEIAELLTQIKEGDALALTTWKTLKKLGWTDKAEKAPKAEKVAKAPKKATKVPKAPKGPGVIATIIEVLKKGKPVTKEAILAVLVKRFPDRNAESMGKTINVQIPNRISKEQKIKVKNTEKGYVIG